jgi:hypothetical protein
MPNLNAVIDRGFSFVEITGSETKDSPFCEIVARDLMPEYAHLFAAAPDAVKALKNAPVHRLGETPEDFIERYKVWYREDRRLAVLKSTGGQS